MTAPPGKLPRQSKLFIDLPNSRFYFGGKFIAAVVLAVVSILIPLFSDSTGISGKVAGPAGGIIGVVIGLPVQPSPRPEDHISKARSAIQSLNYSIELIQGVSQIGAQIGDAEELYRIRIGLANMDVDLNRAARQIQLSMAEWDHVSPGAVKEFKKYQKRGHEMLIELQAKGYDE